jgi:hypothetical protein
VTDIVESDWRIYRAVLAYALMAIVELSIWTTVMLVAYQQGGAGAAGLAAGVSLLPAAILSPFLGSVGDRIPRGTALAGCYCVAAVIVAILAVLLKIQTPLWSIVAMASAVAVVISVARPIHYASLPQLATGPNFLVWGNSATAFAAGIGGFAGPALAGLAAATFGSWSLAAAASVAMFAAAGLALRLRLPKSGEESSNGAWHEAVAGLRHVGTDAPVLALLALSGFAFVVHGALEILGVTFASSVLGLNESSQGLLVGAPGIGSLGGALLGVGLAYRRRLAFPVSLGLVVAGLPLMFMGGVGALSGAVVLIALFGLGERFSSLASEALVQRATDDFVLARVFAVWESITLFGFAAGSFLAPVLVSWLGAQHAFLPLGLGLALLALLLWPVMRSLDDRAIFRTDVLQLFKGVSFLAAMPPAALDRLSNMADWEDLEAGDVVITQGDEGDSYYVVQEGTLSLAVDGTVQRNLGAGQGFGEVGLLYDRPRAATVTALEPTRLLVVERDEFLAAVTRSVDGHRIAKRVAAAQLARTSGHPSAGVPRQPRDPH